MVPGTTRWSASWNPDERSAIEASSEHVFPPGNETPHRERPRGTVARLSRSYHTLDGRRSRAHRGRAMTSSAATHGTPRRRVRRLGPTAGTLHQPKTIGQKKYVDAIRNHTVVFGIGPAGTGKTYLAMAVAVQALMAKQVNRLILTRPAVEAGEKLGFLPGTLSEKIDPYLRPLYDALYEMIDAEQIARMMERGTIEVAPLAYMRGPRNTHDRQVLTPDGFQRSAPGGR